MCIDQCLCVNRSQIKSVHHIKRVFLYTRLDLNSSIHMDNFYDVLMNVTFWLVWTLNGGTEISQV